MKPETDMVSGFTLVPGVDLLSQVFFNVWESRSSARRDPSLRAPNTAPSVNGTPITTVACLSSRLVVLAPS